MKPTLFLLAAGMGSRYGGLKQLDTLGPQGQSIMDYSIYDAIKAGFGKIVSANRFLQNMKVTFHASFVSNRSMHSQRDSQCPKVVLSHGVQTMQC